MGSFGMLWYTGTFVHVLYCYSVCESHTFVLFRAKNLRDTMNIWSRWQSHTKEVSFGVLIRFTVGQITYVRD